MHDDDLIAGHSAYLRSRGRRERTIYSREGALRLASRTIGAPLTDLTREQLQAYLDEKDKPATKRAYLAHFRGFYEWCVDEGHMAADPSRRVYVPKLPKAVPHPMAEHDLRAAMADAPPDVRAWMLLAAEAGLRACEIALVRGEHVIEYPTPYLFLPETKGGGQATVPLSDVLLEELRRWPRSGPIWGTSELHYQTVSRKVSEHLQSHGLPKGYRLHSLRHRFATMVYATNGHDLRATQELLRHASPATTAVYAATDPATGRAAVNRLPRIT